MVNTKGVAFVFFMLSITGTFGYQALNKQAETILAPQTISSVRANTGVTLDDFIKQTLNEDKQVALQDESGDDKFKILKLDTLLTNTDFQTTGGNILDYTHEISKLHKMQKLAVYISDNYNVELPNAEKIVYSTFIESQKKNLDPTLVLSLIQTESTFNQYSKSKYGAVGLTQVMPKVHKLRISQLWKDKMDIWSIKGNIKVGTDILKDYVDLAGGNVQKALQMYNGSTNGKYSNRVMEHMRVLNTVALS